MQMQGSESESLGSRPQKSQERAGTLLDFQRACLNTNQRTSHSSHGVPSFKAWSPRPSGRCGRLACQSQEGGGRPAETLCCVVLWSRPRSSSGPPLPALPQGTLSSLENQNIGVVTGKSPLLSRPLSRGAMPSLVLVSDLESGPIQSGPYRIFKQATTLNVNQALRPSALWGSVSRLG